MDWGPGVQMTGVKKQNSSRWQELKETEQRFVADSWSFRTHTSLSHPLLSEIFSLPSNYLVEDGSSCRFTRNHLNSLKSRAGLEIAIQLSLERINWTNDEYTRSSCSQKSLLLHQSSPKNHFCPQNINHGQMHFDKERDQTNASFMALFVKWYILTEL